VFGIRNYLLRIGTRKIFISDPDPGGQFTMDLASPNPSSLLLNRFANHIYLLLLYLNITGKHFPEITFGLLDPDPGSYRSGGSGSGTRFLARAKYMHGYAGLTWES
jgi:hypothetical protein